MGELVSSMVFLPHTVGSGHGRTRASVAFSRWDTDSYVNLPNANSGVHVRSCVVYPKQVVPRTPALVWLCFVFKLLGTHANEELVFELFNISIRYVAMQAVLSSYASGR